jgi:hydroxymethylpyrimidine/phosphomethylpyrimidine kinase
MIPLALTIAGSDPGGGAGIQADLKTFHRFGVYGTAVISLLTVQNTVRLSRSYVIDSELVAEQLDAVLEDLPPAAVKTGALGSEAIVRVLGERTLPLLVIDPILESTSGIRLLEQAPDALKRLLFPKSELVMPNLPEASALTGREVKTVAQMREAARRIADFGPRGVLIKGGHLETGDALDLLFYKGVFAEFAGPRIETRHTHGTGCTYSAAVTALLARGSALEEAIGRAKAFIAEAIRTAPGLGAGAGPLNHWAETRDSL